MDLIVGDGIRPCWVFCMMDNMLLSYNPENLNSGDTFDPTLSFAIGIFIFFLYFYRETEA